jgi:hypothetical protein
MTEGSDPGPRVIEDGNASCGRVLMVDSGPADQDVDGPVPFFTVRDEPAFSHGLIVANLPGRPSRPRGPVIQLQPFQGPKCKSSIAKRDIT